ncbi:MAG: hypothetical protein JO284_00280 [Planctomycetaceae bacterium]|nr:hypothetical protein [Planctomycetaceae bacterium]MBV8318450.1 hypothetical protein [Planctomycetaceae bacterium]MBV8384357.1 hypothetical protein [Planctomycetaceae bacterium]MBV8554156.1 hypothetical protein [Planctomycetaceae bacterium]
MNSIESPPSQPGEALRTGDDFDPAERELVSGQEASTRLRDRFVLRPAQLVALLLLGVAFLFADLPPLYHSDIWGHLAVGRWIVEHGRLPAREPLSPFTDREAPYVHFCWAGQVVLHLAFRAGEVAAGGDAIHRVEGGVEFLRAGFALLVLLRFLALLVALRRVGGSLGLACLGLAVALAASTGHIAVARPQVAGELFFALLLMTLSREVPSHRTLVGVPALLVVWANVHGSYVLGLALPTILMAGRAIEIAKEAETGSCWRRVTADPRIRRLAWMVLASAVAVAVLNPHGPRLFWLTLRTGNHPNMATQTEWNPMGIHRFGWHGYYFALIGLLAATRLLSPHRSSPTEVLMMGFAVIPPFQQRWMVWWVMVAPWVMLPHWAAIAQRLGWSWVWRPGRRNWRMTVLAAQLVIAFALFSTPVRWLVRGRPETLDHAIVGTPWRLAETLRTPGGPSAYRIPALDRALRAYYPGGRFRGNIFPNELLGDYLVWALPADYPVLVYSHVHIFSREYWYQCRAAKYGLWGWREFLDAHRVNLVVFQEERLRNVRTRALYKDPDWVGVIDARGDWSRNPEGRLFIALRKKPL